LIAALLLAAAATSDIAVGMPADALIERVVARYGTMKHYRDCGEAVDPSLLTADKITFKTAFARPEKIRFEWNEPRRGIRHVVASDGTETHTVWKAGKDPEETRDDYDLNMALNSAAGASRGASIRVPGLLLWGKIDGPTIRNIRRSKIEREDVVDARPVWVAAGEYGDLFLRLFVDKADFVILRTELASSLGPKDVLEVVSYKPDLTGAVGAEDLQATF
jgi:outer membrane lipoprotein-sorting protein